MGGGRQWSVDTKFQTGGLCSSHLLYNMVAIINNNNTLCISQEKVLFIHFGGTGV
jgi:hypothetical protein